MAGSSDEPVDVHQHLWPPALIDALRARPEPPMLRGWTLHLAGEPPYEVDPTDHDVAARAALLTPAPSPATPAHTPAAAAAHTPPSPATPAHTPAASAHTLPASAHTLPASARTLPAPAPARTLPAPASAAAAPSSGALPFPAPFPFPRALVSLSSPLGLEDLAPEIATPLLDAWHDGAAGLPPAFGAWAAVGGREPDLDDLRARLTGGFVGLQVPATWLLTPAALETLAPVLAVCQENDKPVLVHPGPATSPVDAPAWWPAVVDYVSQLQAAWWAWHEAGRRLLPTLRIGFVAGAGLAPLHHERLTARGGRVGAVDPNVFVETSSYGPQAVDALVRALGIDPVVRGSDHPYAEPATFGFGAAADAAIDVRNPRRFLRGGTP